ncbi:MAG: hypothetical protein CV088_04030 [Nitrospira sp. LK70]|nr:hypothetical protein [Nitrospira sp. LK70]
MKLKQACIAVLLNLLLVGVAYAGVNFKSQYCNGQDYVGNDGNKYPHLHCGKDFLVFSESKNNHKYLGKGDDIYCERTRAALDKIRPLVQNNAIEEAALNDTLSFARDYCKKNK